MKKVFFTLATLVALVSCKELKEEWQPVVTFSYDEARFVPVNMDDEVNTTIAELKALYTNHGTPVVIDTDRTIKGQVVSSDEDGNVYREIYIQDATGGICLKLGRSSSYDDYKIGQVLYVRCEDLCIGEYGYKTGNYGGCGQLQLGLLGDGWQPYLDGETTVQPEYETAYIDLMPIVKKHNFRGEILPESERIATASPAGSALSSADFKDGITNKEVGQLTLLKNVRIGNLDNKYEVFALFYPDPNLDHTKNESWNRIFMSDITAAIGNPAQYPYGITTWALTKTRTEKHIENGDWDDVTMGDDGQDENGNKSLATRYVDPAKFGYEGLYKDVFLAHSSAQSVSHYCTYDGAIVQVRTSGYARFADTELPEGFLKGTMQLDMLGIMSRYQGSAQFILLDAYKAGTTDSVLK